MSLWQRTSSVDATWLFCDFGVLVQMSRFAYTYLLNYLIRGRVARYCLSVRDHTVKVRCLKLTKFYVRVAGGVKIRYVLPVLRMASCLLIIGRICDSNKVRITWLENLAIFGVSENSNFRFGMQTDRGVRQLLAYAWLIIPNGSCSWSRDPFSFS